MSNFSTFGQAISEARKAQRLSQKELAEKIIREENDGSISPQYLNDIERDRRIPVSYLIEQFAKILKLDKDYLHFLAGRVPDDLRSLRVDQHKFAESMMAFRRDLGIGKKKNNASSG